MCPTSAYNGLLCENTVFCLFVWKRRDVTLCLWLPAFSMSPCEINIKSIAHHTDYLPQGKDHECAFSVWSQSPVSKQHNNLANVKITSPRTRGRNLAPSCHNSSQEALSKHLTPTGLHWLHIQGEHLKSTPHFSSEDSDQVAREHKSSEKLSLHAYLNIKLSTEQ